MKIKLIMLIGILKLNFFSAQIPDEPMNTTSYSSFYNQTIAKLNNVIPDKSIYYGQPLSVFLQKLNQNNLLIKEYDPAPYNNKLLSFGFVWNRQITEYRFQNDYVEPIIKVYFQQPFNYPQAISILNNTYHSYWNSTAEDFYKNMIVEKIEFWYVNGLTDKNSPPK